MLILRSAMLLAAGSSVELLVALGVGVVLPSSAALLPEPPELAPAPPPPLPKKLRTADMVVPVELATGRE